MRQKFSIKIKIDKKSNLTCLYQIYKNTWQLLKLVKFNFVAYKIFMLFVWAEPNIGSEKNLPSFLFFFLTKIYCYILTYIKKTFGTWQFGKIGVLINFTIQKLKSKHLVCLSFLLWEFFFEGTRENIFLIFQGFSVIRNLVTALALLILHKHCCCSSSCIKLSKLQKVYEIDDLPYFRE